MKKIDIQKELKEFFASKDGEKLIGQIVLNAVNQALTRTIVFEDGKSERGRVIPKTEKWNILDWLVKYLPAVEAAVRGCQADSASARNRANEVQHALRELPNVIVGLMGLSMNQKMDNRHTSLSPSGSQSPALINSDSKKLKQLDGQK